MQIFVFCFFVLFLGVVQEVEGAIKGDVDVIWEEGEGVVWNYTFVENTEMVATKYLWLYVCDEFGVCVFFFFFFFFVILFFFFLPFCINDLSLGLFL